MIEVGTVSGRTLTFKTFDWIADDFGRLIIKVQGDGGPFKTVFAVGQWEYIKEHGK